MGGTEAGQKNYTYMWAVVTVVISILLHLLYKYFCGKNEKEIHETPTNSGVPKEESAKKNTTESRPSVKNKKRAPWKGKTEFNHPWLLKSLKGHPDTVLKMDFSANGKFMATACKDRMPVAEPVANAGKRSGNHRHWASAPSAPPETTSTHADQELAKSLAPYLLTSKQMWTMGYPLEIEPNTGKAALYINPPSRTVSFAKLTKLDVNAPEFVPGSQSDSGRGSAGSSPRSDSDAEETEAVEHLCVRCDQRFQMTREGEYVGHDSCLYHWGRIGNGSNYTCCRSRYGSKGCTPAKFHVWNGTVPGMNGPLDGYVQAKTARGGVYAVDAEMCYTTAGLELASIVFIKPNGRIVYKSLVKPSSRVLDCNTRFSGIRSRDLARATKTLRDVQNDILGFVGSDTILIGHALENDLRALKLIHGAVVDTSALYPHSRGFPLRRSLKNLSEEYLGRIVQDSSSGHSPYEDARAALDLVLQKLNKEKQDLDRKKLNPFPMPSLQPYDPLINSA